MNRQPRHRSVLHTLLSALTRNAPEQAKRPIQPPQPPAPGDRDAWHAYWKAQGQPWRSEPEIDLKRQQYLAQRRIIQPNTEQGIYPFKDIKLSRADVEWLLETHENRLGPVDWSDEKQRKRQGLDLRGANLRQIDLRELPLAGLRGGLACMEGVILNEAHLEEASLFEASLMGAIFIRANLESVNLYRANLLETHFGNAHMARANLREAHLERATLAGAHLEQAYLKGAHLEQATLKRTNLQGATLTGAHLEQADLEGAHLEGAILDEAHLEEAVFCKVNLERASLENVILSNEKHVAPRLADVQWGSVNLAVVKWSQVNMLGDEYKAQKKRSYGEAKNKTTRLGEYEEATRANRQLAVALQDQGLNEDAARFTYRAQVLQKTVFRLQMLQSNISLRQRAKSLGAWLFSWFLFLLAGYGYRLGRSFFAYLLVIGTFMALYLLLNPHLAWYGAIVVSMTAFHGRGFSASTFTPGDPLSIASVVEAFVGLIIEVTFIATLTRRFFGQ